ncbi:receptor-like protein EIX2 [Eucalyptus grandis]|uniref:receptor-like protein EIX2 n=1 Tax=Eucalyptus grandis TaxID=71139 RepID=UPI00192EB9FF|nr:receptor-like protein EIX2 [Eucalyptus grandis]
MASYDGLVSTVLWAIFVIQVIEFSHSNASTNVSCIGAEREALLKFKHGLTDPSRRLSSWTGEECCKWEGVECNKKTGHVLKLDLHNPCIEEINIKVFVPSNKCMLGGNIVLSLTELKYLKYLDLSVNNFSTQKIPTFFASLQKLEYLNLSHASFNGNIPRQLSNLSKLQYLDLSINFAMGDLTSNDFDWVSKLSSLKYLHMSGVNLSKVKDWIGCINMLPSLQSLGLSFCGLQDISSSLQANFTSLRFLSIGANNLSSIPPWIYNSSKLEHIDLSNRYKFIFFDGIQGPFPTAIVENNQRLVFLDVSWNLIRGDFPKNLSSLCNLQLVRLEGNNLNGNISDILGDSLGCAQSKWKIFDVSDNNISGDMPNQFGDFKELEYLDLSSNLISGSIPANLMELSSLRTLGLHRNGFTGEIPNCLSNMPTIFVIDLSDNEFTGRLPPFGPQSPDLAMINLEKNRFVGGIPPQYCQLKYLKFLSLAQNYISGPIPNCFDGILSMANETKEYSDGIYVDVKVNTKGTSQIYGNTLRYFHSIDLSANMLDGQIPKEFTKLVRLQNLNLSQNKLSGYIPSNIGDLKNLESLDLSRNKLSGTIPPGISSIDFLSHLNLSFNRLSGPIPSGNHLHTVDDESVYRGNDRLCGAPLLNTCPGYEPPGSDGRDGDNFGGDKPSEGDLDIRNWFYAGLGPGFTVGFLGFCSVLHFKGSWRVSYFQAMDKAIEKFSMTTVITMLWFKRTFPRRKKELV